MNLGAMSLTFRDYANAEKSFAKVEEAWPNSIEAHLYMATPWRVSAPRTARTAPRTPWPSTTACCS